MYAGELTPDAPKDAPVEGPGARPIDSAIADVVHEPLRRLVDHRGSLIEAINANDDFWSAPVVHLEYVTIAPGRVKGWGVHRKGADRYVVADGPLRVVLFDGRVESATHGRFAQFHFSREAPGRLYIPAGVWHANHNYSEHEVTILVFPELTYDPADPDKYRVDPHSGSIPFDWSLNDG
jgi:dTDP-4-dehydrorhamnose 3,5-epimerase